LSSWGTNLCYSDEEVCHKKTDGRPSILRFDPPRRKKNTVSIVLGILLPILFVINVCIVIVSCRQRRKKKAAEAADKTNRRRKHKTTLTAMLLPQIQLLPLVSDYKFPKIWRELFNFWLSPSILVSRINTSPCLAYRAMPHVDM
ncbi:hypothetical protein MKW94_019516, partial [Papaver nudicaule]|nr:hypothetical protein [Papaver nudicaule]